MTLVRSSRATPGRPLWVRLVDVAIAVGVVVLLSALFMGGIRARFGDVRITAESPWRIGLVVAVLLAARTYLWRDGTWWHHASRRLGAVTADRACREAIELGVADYRFVRRMLERRLGPQLTLRQVDPLIRELTEYRDFIQQITKGARE